MRSPEERQAVRALSQEKGGMILKAYLESEIEEIKRKWLREIQPFDKEVPDQEKLLMKKIKFQADLEAMGRVVGLMTDPEEARDARA